jgi:alcohol dehydrogenase class IV
MNEPVFVEHWPNRLVMGIGALDRLPEIVAALGAKRALVLCGRTVAGSPLLPRVKSALGSACAGVFDRVTSHTPRKLLDSSVEMARSLKADILVSIGGGSAIDAGKGTALLHATGATLDPYAIRYSAGGEMQRQPMNITTIPHVAIPTTTGSASEVLPTAGIRDPDRREKMLFWDAALVPAAVILDPQMTVETGASLTATSGMTAVARCIEALYSRHRNPLSEGLALHALRLLHAHLPRTVEAPTDLDARFQCLAASAMSGIASINAMASIVHALGHVVGGRYALQHGVSHTILLAPAMRRLLPVMGDRQRLLVDALGGTAASGREDICAAACAALGRFIQRLPLQQRLREINMPAEELPVIAEQTTHDYMMANLPHPMSVADIEALLREAW